MRPSPEPPCSLCCNNFLNLPLKCKSEPRSSEDGRRHKSSSATVTSSTHMGLITAGNPVSHCGVWVFQTHQNNIHQTYVLYTCKGHFLQSLDQQILFVAEGKPLIFLAEFAVFRQNESVSVSFCCDSHFVCAADGWWSRSGSENHEELHHFWQTFTFLKGSKV